MLPRGMRWLGPLPRRGPPRNDPRTGTLRKNKVDRFLAGCRRRPARRATPSGCSANARSVRVRLRPADACSGAYDGIRRGPGLRRSQRCTTPTVANTPTCCDHRSNVGNGHVPTRRSTCQPVQSESTAATRPERCPCPADTALPRDKRCAARTASRPFEATARRQPQARWNGRRAATPMALRHSAGDLAGRQRAHLPVAGPRACTCKGLRPVPRRPQDHHQEGVSRSTRHLRLGTDAVMRRIVDAEPLARCLAVVPPAGVRSLHRPRACSVPPPRNGCPCGWSEAGRHRARRRRPGCTGHAAPGCDRDHRLPAAGCHRHWWGSAKRSMAGDWDADGVGRRADRVSRPQMEHPRSTLRLQKPARTGAAVPHALARGRNTVEGAAAEHPAGTTTCRTSCSQLFLDPSMTYSSGICRRVRAARPTAPRRRCSDGAAPKDRSAARPSPGWGAGTSAARDRHRMG